MARSGRSGPRPVASTPPPTIVNDNLGRRLAKESPANIPVRTCVYIEVGDMPSRDVQQAIIQLKAHYSVTGHPVFILPLRNGKANTDVLFEDEILEPIRALFEIRNGKIEFKTEPKPVDVMRTQL